MRRSPYPHFSAACMLTHFDCGNLQLLHAHSHSELALTLTVPPRKPLINHAPSTDPNPRLRQDSLHQRTGGPAQRQLAARRPRQQDDCCGVRPPRDPYCSARAHGQADHGGQGYGVGRRVQEAGRRVAPRCGRRRLCVARGQGCLFVRHFGPRLLIRLIKMCSSCCKWGSSHARR